MKKKYRIQFYGSNPASANQLSLICNCFFYNLYTVSYKAITIIYIRCPTRRLLCCKILLHILIIFLFRIPCEYSVFSFQVKKTEEFSGYIHGYLAKVKSIPLLQMHDLLEILEHAFSLLVDFSSIHKTTYYITKWTKLVCSNNTFHCN